MSRVDAYIAQVEAERRSRWKWNRKGRGAKARFALIYLVLIAVFVALIETVGEDFAILGPAIQTPMMYLVILPVLGIVLACHRCNLRGLLYNLASIGLALYLMGPIWFKAPRQPRSSTFSVMTFNMEHMIGSRAELIQTLRKPADVIILQEATELASDKEFRDQAFNGFSVVVTEHIAIASRYPVEIQEINFKYLLDFDANKEVFGPNPQDHGYAQIAKIEWDGQHIYVVNTHLSPNFYSREPITGVARWDLVQRNLRYRMAQAKALKSVIAKLDGPVIFGGDFNNAPLGKCYGVLREGMGDSWREVGSGLGWTINSRLPFKRIDYLLHNDYWRAIKAEVGAEDASDHRSYWASFELVKPGKLDPNPMPRPDYLVPLPEPEKPIETTVRDLSVGPALSTTDPSTGTAKNATAKQNAELVKPPSTKPIAKPATPKKVVAKKTAANKKPIRRRIHRRRRH